MKVEVYKLDGNGNDIHVGSLSLEQNRIKANPEGDRTLDILLSFPLYDEGSDQDIYYFSEPETFLNLLHKNYNNPYLRVSKPQ